MAQPTTTPEFDPNALTLQEILDRGVAGIIGQGGPAWDDTGRVCRYRVETDRGTRKCMIGWSIPDALYDPEMDHTSLDEFPKAFGIDFGASRGRVCRYRVETDRGTRPLVHEEVLEELQHAHDDAAAAVSTSALSNQWAFWPSFRAALEDIATHWNLQMPNVRWPDQEQVD